MLPCHMNASRARRLFLLAGLLAAILLIPAARAQEDDRAPVRLDGRTLFRVGPSGDLDATARARRVELRLEALLDSPDAINPAVVEAAESDDADERLITVNAAPIVTCLLYTSRVTSGE